MTPDGQPDAGQGEQSPARHLNPRLSELRPATWRGVLVRSLKGFRRDNCLDFAAGLSFWSLLAMFPALIVVVALVGLVVTSQAAVDTIVQTANELLPGDAASAIEARVREVAGHRTAAGVLLSFGLLGALWTSSAYLRSFTRAANAVYEVEEGRPAYKLLPLQLGLTIIGLVLAAAIVIGLVFSGPVARAAGSALGLGDTVVAVWDTAKWPVLLLLALLLLSLLYWVAPNARQPRRLRWLAVGGLVALILSIAVTAGFGFYVANFAAYDVTYGALGAVIVFLMWLFLINCAVLLGMEINAELQRGRRLQVDGSHDLTEPPLPPRTPA